MTIPCDLIVDLLPLYMNNLCSKVSEAIIAEHLETCEKCNEILDKMEATADVLPYEEDPSFEQLLKAACRCES